MALSGLTGVKALFDTQPDDYCACLPTGTSEGRPGARQGAACACGGRLLLAA